MIELIRLDYRLLHGQVVFSWVSHTRANRIIIADDAVSEDETRKAILKLAKPAGVRLNIFSTQTLISKLPKVLALNERIIIIFGNTQELKTFVNAYSEIPEINYGATVNKAGSRQYGGSVFLTPEEQADTQEILDKGIKIFIQQTPPESKTWLSQL